MVREMDIVVVQRLLGGVNPRLSRQAMSSNPGVGKALRKKTLILLDPSKLLVPDTNEINNTCYISYHAVKTDALAMEPRTSSERLPSIQRQQRHTPKN